MENDIELEIGSGSGPGDYTVRVIRALAGGEPSATFTLDVDALLDRRAELEDAVLTSAISTRRTISRAEKPLREVGQQLFQALFTGPVNGTYRASLGAAQRSGQQLRVVLRLTASELAGLPWEMLFDPETESYLCRTRPLLRRIPASDYSPDPLEVVPPLRILGIAASPRDLGALDIDAEKQHLARALAEPIAAGLVELVWVPQATWSSVQAHLLGGPWHIVHFIGHGGYDLHGQEGHIALISASGRSDMVESSRLVDLLREADPTPQLVVLNSCSTGEAGEEDLFSGTAAALVRGGISAVVAMQFAVSDTAAVAFARGFYDAIAHGRDIDKAAGSGRTSILGLASLEWVTPVLYVRGSSTRLFTLSGRPVPHKPGPPPGPEVNPVYLALGGMALLIAGLTNGWFHFFPMSGQQAQTNYSVYVFAHAAALALFVLAGLPDGSRTGRIILGIAACAALLTIGNNTVALMYTLRFVEVACGLWAGGRLVQARTLTGWPRWLLLLLFVSLTLVTVLEMVVPLAIWTTLLFTAAGALFVLAALRLAKGCPRPVRLRVLGAVTGTALAVVAATAIILWVPGTAGKP
ncbi:hypothetical protein GCM10023081_27150 [Arthrobacter ginkgonis]|uniref:CHAT domain-containing protein n=1 Tax=Arthrobacter ginkgonis TaxID=1630594 RepID=A0ABP7CHA4_9MICC